MVTPPKHGSSQQGSALKLSWSLFAWGRVWGFAPNGADVSSPCMEQTGQRGVAGLGARGRPQEAPSPVLQLPAFATPRCETKCRNGTYGENCAFVCSDCVNGECHFETGRCLCRAGSHGT